MKKILGVLIFISLLFVFTGNAVAQDQNLNCDNRFATLVNPVRGTNLWGDKSAKPLIDQYNASARYKYPATWLFQYDALDNNDLMSTVKNFSIKGEDGLFLEVSKKLAGSAGVDFNTGVRWSHPGVVFLSAYSQSDRRKLIDTVYSKFKSVFGYYPKSVGAWWIDSYSLKYIKEKYGLSAVMIVADQKTTDSYGVWGQWWGYPYIPSTANVLTPAEDIGLGAVVIQWAQRDPTLAFGGNASFSNYSLQANDYIRNGKDTKYFKTLVNKYLDCRNKLGQITIGMETGMEADQFAGEYSNQLAALSSESNIKFLTMSDFAEKYLSIYQNKNPHDIWIGDWRMNTGSRTNVPLNELSTYKSKIAFSDYFLPDKSDFLNRELDKNMPLKNGTSNYLLILIVLLSFLFFMKLEKLNYWLSFVFFILPSYALVWLSTKLYGWVVFYGFNLTSLYTKQITIAFVSASVFMSFIKISSKKIKDINLFLLLLPLSFSFDGLVSLLRITKLSGQAFVGIFTDPSIFGVTIGNHGIRFLRDFASVNTINYFYKFPFDVIYQNFYLNIFIYPLAHLLIAIVLYKLLYKCNMKLKFIVLGLLSIFYIVFLNIILSKDPLLVLPITK